MTIGGLFNFLDTDALGSVVSVDTATVSIKVLDIERLRRVQVNRLVALQSSRAGQHLIGVVTRITRQSIDGGGVDGESEAPAEENNVVRVLLIGTLHNKIGLSQNVFRRTLETVPEIDSNCFSLEGEALTSFMRTISSVQGDGAKLSLGTFTLDEEAEALLNGNKLFQRHLLVVGSTGSGKSWTIARLLDQLSQLKQSNAIVFDIHGEYNTLEGAAFRHLKIAGPADLDKGKSLDDGVLYLPYWLLGYEALVSLFVDRSDQNAPNQAMMISKCVTESKRNAISDLKYSEILANFTIDSPIPFDISEIISELERANSEMVPSSVAGKEKQGPYFDKLSRMIARLEAKLRDRRLGFLFQPPKECMEMGWLEKLAHRLVDGAASQSDGKGGIKIIDFSEVPSDVLPLVVSLVAMITFVVNQWTPRSNRHPISIFCDEAHLYIPERTSSESADSASVRIFERIAKEGRKYGVGIVVISQRPSEVNRTVLSQCNNVIAMRLTNGDDQSVVSRLLPDSLGGFASLLPILDVGEALVVGDASLLPTRVRVTEPKQKPDSGTVPFWDEWESSAVKAPASQAVQAWRKQSMT